MKPLDRRTVLRGGATALGLPFLEAMMPAGRQAQAQAQQTPKRIVFFQTPNGIQMDQWRCTVNNGDPRNWALSPTLSPLAAFKDRLLVLEGIAQQSSYDPAQQATAHQGGAASVWTGTHAGPGTMDGGGNRLSGYAVSHSLDYELSRKMHIGGTTKFRAYHFGVLPTVDHLISRMFYSGKDQPIGPNADPADVYRQLYADQIAGAEALARQTRQRRSVLSAVMDDYRSLRCKLSGGDRQVVERHLTQIEEIEARLGRGSGGTQTCDLVDLGAPMNFRDRRLVPQLGRLQMDLMVSALTCDLTRVAALQWQGPVGHIVYEWLNQSEPHHAITHRPGSDAVAQAKLAAIDTWYAGEFAYLLQKMDSVVEGNGRTLLDNSVVIWTSEISTGWSHNRRDMPYVLAGGCQGFFDTGRCIKYTGDPAHNRLLLSLLAAMDAPAQTFGTAEYCAGGPLSELT